MAALGDRGKKGDVEAYRSGRLELCAGDRVRFTRNDRDAGRVNGQMARVAGIEEDEVRFELEDGGTITLGEGHPSLRFLDHAWATTIHSFQGRTVDTIVAAMESGNRALVNRKALYVAISRARYRAELITDDGRKGNSPSTALSAPPQCTETGTASESVVHARAQARAISATTVDWPLCGSRCDNCPSGGETANPRKSNTVTISSCWQHDSGAGFAIVSVESPNPCGGRGDAWRSILLMAEGRNHP